MAKSTRRRYQQAWAPYNFVPMPDKPLYAQVDEHGIPQVHDRYLAKCHTGYFTVNLRTVTPLFIRGMLTVSEREYTDIEIRNHPDFFGLRDKPPVIPGSSLRGMIRTLTEIATKSKMHFVSDANPMYYRAVAADRTDPLKDPYRKVIGSFAKNVRAGYLVRSGGRWYVQPAEKIGRAFFGKVKEWNKKNNYSPVEGVRGLIRFNSPDYKVQYHDVCFDANGDFISRVYTPAEGEEPDGVLVCTGNMAETQGKGNRVNSPRRNYALVSSADSSAKQLLIPEQIVNSYLEGLTAFQKEKPFDENYGVLKAGRPVFYIEQGGQVIHLGHTPNFRIAPLTVDNNVQRAKNPRDLVPPALRQQNPKVDYAEAMFGYVSEQDENKALPAYAGRISVTSAFITQERDSYTYDPIVPRILASPKPTTFQHYLNQPNGTKTPTHQLQHYGDNTVIRGYKLYWRQKLDSLAQVEEPDKSLSPDNSTQHTRISPLREDTHFSFKVFFENLSDFELGALGWVLTLGGDDNAYHQLGMGKPLGLGVVKLTAELTLTNRTDESGRYGSLFNEDGTWHIGTTSDSNSTLLTCIDQFKQQVNFDTDTRYRDLEAMLKLRGTETMKRLQPDKRRDFDYMKIEPQNDYDGRPVLPTPTEIDKGIYDG
ncbi:MAG: TIGR03986 family CRISPR-associated RAMP protein [Chloroflexota bacterium]